MNNELKSLLEKYETGSIDSEERNRLKELIRTDEGRIAALKSSAPETIFLADEEQKLPEWDDYWSKFEVRIIDQDRIYPSKPKYWRYAVAAAVVLIVAFVSLPYLFQTSPQGVEIAENQVNTFSYELKSRVPAEILPQIRKYMSESASLRIDGKTNSLEIEDTLENILVLQEVLPQLDRKPIQMNFNIKFLIANNPDVMSMKMVDSLPMEKLDIDDFQIAADIEITPMEGRHYRTIIDERYDVSCFIHLSPDATEAEIVDLRIYDRITKAIVLTQTGVALPVGWTRSVETNKTQKDIPVVVAISLLPTEQSK